MLSAICFNLDQSKILSSAYGLNQAGLHVDVESNSSVVQDLRTDGRWFKSMALPIFFPRIDDSHYDKMHSSLNAVNCFNDGYDEKQPVAWEGYCVDL